MIVDIGDKSVGEGCEPYIIAEAGANANNDIGLAFKLVEKAAEAGADAIKFQHYKAKSLVTSQAKKYYVDTLEEWERNNKPSGNQLDEFSQLDGLSFEQWKEIKTFCDQSGITFLSTPFDFEQLDVLEQLGVPAFKIASADITYHQLLREIARRGKPVILSTGASTREEVEKAVSVIESEGNRKIILLQCTLHYPCHPNEVNIRMMRTLKDRFPDYPIGLSDHSLGLLAPIVAVSNGAMVIEKHYTIDKSLPTSTDHFMSVDPVELKRMVEELKLVPQILGDSRKIPIENEKLAVAYARRSLTTIKKISIGEMITTENTTFKRPGTGVSPIEAETVIGSGKAKVNIPEDTTITFDMVETV